MVIEGDVGTIIVNAPDIRLIIRNASVSRLEVNCEGAADIAVAEGGRVSDVVVGSEARGTAIDVGGHVENIETSAPDSTISGTGSVDTVTVNAGADNTSVTTPETVITNKGASGVTAGGGKPVPQYGSATNNHDGSDILADPPEGPGGGVASGGDAPSDGGGQTDGGEPSYVTVSAVSVGGMAVAGETLTANTTPSGASLIYQWQISDSADGTYTDISGATSKTYVLAVEDAGNWIRVRTTGTGNYIGTVIGAAFGPIRSATETYLTMSTSDVAGIIGEQFNMAVTVRGNVAYEDRNNMIRFYGVIPNITGSAIEFRTIPGGFNQEIVTDETERGYAGADADDLVLAWGPVEGTPLSDIDISSTSPAVLNLSAAINSTGYYAITFVSYDITGQKQLNGINETAAITIVDLQSMAIEGNVEVGGTLTAAAGIMPSDAPITYQWLRNGVPIDGAVGEIYTITVADVGRHLSVTASYGTESETSVPTEMVKMGDGSAENPYAVATAEQLDTFVRENFDKYYEQIEDIDLSGYDNWLPITLFDGVYDGKGHTISNLKINLPDSSNVGLISEMRQGELKNIRLEGVDVAGYRYVGGLVGFIQSEIGRNKIKNSYVSGSVSGNFIVGGLIGESGGVFISSSHADCYVSGAENVGGLAGRSTISTIENSYATGNVSGTTNVGGLVGYANHSTIVNAYAVGEVTGTSDTGGLVGKMEDSSVTSCYYDSTTTMQTDTGKGEPRTTTQMKEGEADDEIGGEPIYTGWSTDVWDFGGDDDYPVLKFD